MADFSAPKNSGSGGGGVFLVDAELEALQRLMHAGYPFAYVLYVQEIRRYMDMATGVVGERRRISEKGMQETLERSAGPGPNGSAKSRTRDFIQRQLSALERYGLLVRLPKATKRSPMLFLLPLAVAGSIRAQETRTKIHTKIHTITRTNEAEKKSADLRLCSDTAEKPAQEPAQEPALRPAQHHVKITTTTETGVFSQQDLASVDLQMVVDAYHQALPGLPPLRVPTEGHRLLVARVWWMATEPPGKHQTERFWRGYFAACARSEFLMGRVVPNQRKGPFRANFKTLVDPATVLKIINGEYT